MIKNSLLYGSARASRSLVYLLVAVWYGVSSDTDSFFLVYVLATFLVTSFSSVLGMVIIPKIEGVSVWDLVLPLLTFYFLFNFLGIVLSSPLLVSFSLFVACSFSASLLAGRLAKEGNTTIPPLATLLGVVITLIYALNSKELGGLGFALGFGEATRYGILLYFSRHLVTTGTLTLYKYLPYLVVFALFSFVLPLTRLIPNFIGNEGDVTLLSYALGLVMGVITFPSLGALVTNGSTWTGKVNIKQLEEQVNWFILAPIIWIGVMVAWGFLPTYQSFFSSSIYWPTLFKLVIILSLGLPAFIIVYGLVPAMVMDQTKGWLFGISIGYVATFIVLYSFGIKAFGLYGGAGAFVMSEYILALVFLEKGVGFESLSSRYG